MRKIVCPITSKELYDLVWVEKLTDVAIAKRLGSTKKRVQSWRKQYGISSLPRWQRNVGLPIEGRLLSLLVGSMLGDGRLVRQVGASYFTERHGENQRAYLEWKLDFWKPMVRGGVFRVNDPRGFVHYGFSTNAHGCLNSWQELFYGGRRGWKRLVPEIIDFVDNFALAVWFLDDGTASWWPEICFGMSSESRQVAFDIFKKFGLNPSFVVRRGKTGKFVFREEDALRFISLIEDYVPECMTYKLKFGFLNRAWRRSR